MGAVSSEMTAEERAKVLAVAQGQALKAADIIATRAAVLAMELRAMPHGSPADLAQAAERIETAHAALREHLRVLFGTIHAPAEGVTVQ